MDRIRLWDFPTRLFHWLLVLAIIGLVATGKIGGNLMVYHEYLGVFVAALIVFRIVWGFIGSTYARFLSFFPTPASIFDYLKGSWRGVGHNPLGACSVFALLGLVLFQLLTGLFSYNDTTFTNGPLTPLLDSVFHVANSSAVANRLTSMHRIGVNVLIFFVALHVASIIFYALFKKQYLLMPMITGWQDVAPSSARSARGGGLVTFILAVVLAAGAAWGASGIWITPPPPPAAADVPDW